MSNHDYRALCAELLADYDNCHYRSELSDRARAALAQPEPVAPTDEGLKATYWEAFKDAAPCGADESWLAGLRAVARWDRPVIEPDGPAVLGSREPASVVDQPTDKELLELMPETMRDEFSYAAKTCSDATGGRVKPGILRVALNTTALEYARAVLARWGTANNTINQEDLDG
jgi:hypothetical protein